MLVEDMLRNKIVTRFEYHTFYVLYLYGTYLLTLPLKEYVLRLLTGFVWLSRRKSDGL
jgi:hypothetical protein